MRTPSYLATMPPGPGARCGRYTRAGRRCRLPAAPGAASCALHAQGERRKPGPPGTGFLSAARAQLYFAGIILRAWLARRRQQGRRPFPGQQRPGHGTDVTRA
jgi:hypothetical protein